MRAGVCICRIMFLTGASNNHHDSFPFVLSFASFCALHHSRRARSALPCYLPLCFPIPLPTFLWAPHVRPVYGFGVSNHSSPAASVRFYGPPNLRTAVTVRPSHCGEEESTQSWASGGGRLYEGLNVYHKVASR